MDKKTIWKTIIQNPDRYWNYAGRHQLHGAVNEARSPRQHKHEIKTPAASGMRGG